MERAAKAPLARFGDYELLNEIARGGMGVVYRARQVSLDRVVALKMILHGKFASDDDIRRFQTEAQAAARLNHPNIVAVHEIGIREGQHYFSMDYVDGPDLAQLIHDRPLAPERAATIVKDIAEAIHVAHRNGILHRDLKPANVIMDAADQPHVTDFGLAKRLEDVTARRTTGAVMGSPCYMAPEQIEGKQSAFGPATDVYSLGAILAELLTCRPPFLAETPVEILRQALWTEPISPRVINPRVPRDLEVICLKCLAKRPADRYATAQALAEDLHRYLDSEPVHAMPISAFGKLWRWCFRKPLVAALTGASALLLSVAGVAAVFRVVDAANDRERMEEQRADVLQINAYAARFVANSILLQLREISQGVADLAHDPEFKRRLARGDRAGLAEFLADARVRLNVVHKADWLVESPLESLHVQDAAGAIVARAPENITGDRFAQRDYFVGALRHSYATGLDAIHISRVYKSYLDPDGQHKLGISIAINSGAADADAAPQGVLVGALTTGPTLSLNDAHRKVMLVARADPTDEHHAHVVLLHPLFGKGHPAVGITWEHDFPKPSVGPELRSAGATAASGIATDRDAHFRDPVGRNHPGFSGRWLAGFAPVGQTELMVVVQTRDADIIRPDRTLVRDLAFWRATGVFLLVVACGAAIGFIAWRELHRRRAA
jgi:predicted Ser/Thr protein kinase